MAPVFDHPQEEHIRRAGSRPRLLENLAKRNVDTESSGGALRRRKPLRLRQNPSRLLPLRDDHRQNHGGDRDDDDDEGRRKNRLQQNGDDDDEDDRKTSDLLQSTPPPPPPPLPPLTVTSAALTTLPPLTTSSSTSLLPLLTTSSVSSSSTSIPLLTTSSTPIPLLTTSSISKSQSFSTLQPLPTLTAATGPPALNPQVVTVSSVTVMTTTSVVPVTATSSPSSFITSLFPTTSTTESQSATAAFDTLPSPTIFISDNGDKHDDGHRDAPPPGGLSPTAEDVLISAGSIGMFDHALFVCCLVPPTC